MGPSSISIQRTRVGASSRPPPELPTIDELGSRHECAREASYRFNHCGSFMSLVSALSVLSLFSALSTASIASAGSVLSVLSIGSSLSVLSIGSVRSYMSVGSHACSYRLFADCDAAYPDAAVRFRLDVAPGVWDNMSACSFDDYQRYKRYEPEGVAHECDYQRANCSYENLETGVNFTAECRVRRKGFTTWEEMDDKPSLKLKFEDTMDFGVVRNESFAADELTLNNMKYSDSWSGEREVEAYDVFRRIGVAHTPLSAHAEVVLLRGGEEQSTERYALLENINDGGFLKRAWREDHPDDEYDDGGYMLLEVDNTGLEFKKGKKSMDTDEDASIELFKDLVNRDGELVSYMDTEQMSLFYIAEELTRSWDGACMRYIPNNHYVLATRAEAGPVRVSYLPGGLDRVFQGCNFHLGQSGLLSSRMEAPYCGPMLAILADEDGAARYEALKTNATQSVDIKSRTCADDALATAMLIGLSAGASLVLACMAYVCVLNLKETNAAGARIAE